MMLDNMNTRNMTKIMVSAARMKKSQIRNVPRPRTISYQGTCFIATPPTAIIWVARESNAPAEVMGVPPNAPAIDVLTLVTAPFVKPVM